MSDIFQTAFDPLHLTSLNPVQRPNISQNSPYSIPAFDGVVGGNGNLLPNYTLQTPSAQRIQNNPWVQMATQQNNMATGQQLDSASKSGNAATASAWSQLAARGGLSEGAKQNIARTGANATMNNRQGIKATGAQNNLQIGQQGEEMEKQNNEINLQTMLADNQLKNQYNQNTYNQQMQAWSAGQSATATEHSGKKG